MAEDIFIIGQANVNFCVNRQASYSVYGLVWKKTGAYNPLRRYIRSETILEKILAHMITRTWHGKTHRNDADRYLNFLLTEGTREYKQTPGNISVRVWQSMESDTCHFWTVTEWKDIESIRAFAGDDYEKAKYYPFDEGILLEFEERVNHYQSFAV